MCYTVYTTVSCTLQSVSRVILTAVFAVEDLIKLVVHTTHTYISTCFQCFALLPVCFAYCCFKQCYSSSACRTGCYSNTPGWGCTLVVTVVLLLIVIYFYTYWIEEFFENYIKIPCSLFRKNNEFTHKALHGFKTRSLLLDTIGFNRTLMTKSIPTDSTLLNEYVISSEVTFNKTNEFLDDYFNININNTDETSNDILKVGLKENDDENNLTDTVERLKDRNRIEWLSIEEVLSTDHPPRKLYPFNYSKIVQSRKTSHG